MRIRVFDTKDALGVAAAREAAEGIRAAIAQRGAANVVVATGASQFEMLAHLVKQPDIEWPKVTAFHLDEYVGMGSDHPASFRRYLRERFVAKIGGLAAFHEVRGDAADPAAECRRLGELIAARPIDVSCIGIGENGHVAFNDPPADFETEEPFIVVDLDEACRKQQLGEGWFATLDDVPSRAISMSVRQILKTRMLIVSVPDERKAEAVRATVESAVSPDVPATKLREHADCRLFLDHESASLLSDAALREAGGQ
ncbi:MAG: glucosamine-6-phosphate deaminase [Planctomycetota bacterium]|jgi:glucosamine-6-phosphate deaminase